MEKEYVDFSNLDLNGIISKFKDMLESEDHKDLFANAEMAKSVFYKVLNVEKEKEGALTRKGNLAPDFLTTSQDLPAGKGQESFLFG